MKYNISKELFEAVMGFKTKSITIGNFIFWEMEDGYKPDYGISVDAFYFQCKEWAFDKFNYEIYTSTTYGYVLSKENNLVHESISLESEQQYCFDACQWILDNKDKQ